MDKTTESVGLQSVKTKQETSYAVKDFLWGWDDHHEKIVHRDNHVYSSRDYRSSQLIAINDKRLLHFKIKFRVFQIKL